MGPPDGTQVPHMVGAWGLLPACPAGLETHWLPGCLFVCPQGVRSVALREHLLSFGTGRGKIAFVDLRKWEPLQLGEHLVSFLPFLHWVPLQLSACLSLVFATESRCNWTLAPLLSSLLFYWQLGGAATE